MKRKSLVELKQQLDESHAMQMTESAISDWLVFRNDAGDILFTARRGALFDADGMYFEDDVQ